MIPTPDYNMTLVDSLDTENQQLRKRIAELEAEVARVKDDLIDALFTGNHYKDRAEAAEAKVARVMSELEKERWDDAPWCGDWVRGWNSCLTNIKATLQEPEHE